MTATTIPTVNQGQTTARDGARIVWHLYNPEGTRRVALVHALAMDGRFWDGVAASLPGDVAVLGIDCRGHGASEKSPGPYSVEQFADDLADVFKDLGWQDALVGGASMGGCVALAFAARHPGLVGGLTLIDTTAWYGADAPKAWEERGQKGAQEGLAALVAFQKSRWFSPGFLERAPEAVEGAVATFLRNDPACYLETCRMLGKADLRASLAGFSFPTAIVVGEHDYATPPAMAEEMAAAIPGATVTVLPEVRHFTPLEVPRAIAASLLDTLDRQS